MNAEDLIASVQPRLAAATGSACTSGIPESSHVLQATGLNAAEADSSVRFSFGRFTGDHEPREAAMVVASALHGTG